MFVVREDEAAAIRAVYEQRGEFSAAVELRRLFPAITGRAPVAIARYSCGPVGNARVFRTAFRPASFLAAPRLDQQLVAGQLLLAQLGV